MNTNYKRMFVLNEDEYKEFKRYKATLIPTLIETPTSVTVKCPICGREYPNENIMAHHLKSHVEGFKCNICGKVFKFKRSLTAHLKKHAPQVEPSRHSVLDNNIPNQHMHRSAPPLHHSAPPLYHSAPTLHYSAPPLHHSAPNMHRVASVMPRKPHKHKSVINFTVKKWLTLK